MHFVTYQKVTCLSHVPEDMPAMHKLVASMIHHAVDLFKVRTDLCHYKTALQCINQLQTSVVTTFSSYFFAGKVSSSQH